MCLMADLDLTRRPLYCSQPSKTAYESPEEQACRQALLLSQARANPRAQARAQAWAVFQKK